MTKRVKFDPKRISRGTPERQLIRTVVGFDPETFEQIRKLAIKGERSFAAQIRELVEFGLIDVTE